MKIKILAVLLALSFGFTGLTLAGVNDYTMIVSPARYSVLQVVFDVITKRPAVLVSYQQGEDGADPLLHVWNGTSWTQIGLHDLGELSFVKKTPSRVVLLGDDELLPSSVRDSLSWLPEIIIIRQVNNANLLNDFGRIMDWSNEEWAWFSARYNLELEDEAAAIRNSSWYDQAGPIRKKNQSVYEPVPVVDETVTINPSSTTLPDPESTLQFDNQSTSVESVEVEEVDVVVTENPEAVEDEIQEIVDALEQSEP